VVLRVVFPAVFFAVVFLAGMGAHDTPRLSGGRARTC